MYVERWDLRPWRPPVRPDENRIMPQRELEDLSPDECFRLLAAARVGRLVYQDDLGPLAVPVNYAMADTTSSSASRVARVVVLRRSEIDAALEPM